MRVLEARKILEAATVEYKVREIDTPKVKKALDMPAPICRPQWLVTAFRRHLKPHEEFGPGGEGQKQPLRVYFGGIHDIVMALLAEQIGKLNYRHRKQKTRR